MYCSALPCLPLDGVGIVPGLFGALQLILPVLGTMWVQCCHNFWFIKKNFFLMFVYFWRKERQSRSRGGAEREGDTESEAGSTLCSVSTEPDAGLEPKTREISTLAEVGCLTDWATQVPLPMVFSRLFCFRLITIYMWVYFWAFYSVLLVYVSVFVLLPYHFDYYSFVV